MPVDGLVDVPERGRSTQKFGLLGAIFGPTVGMTTTSAPTITRVKVRLRVEGFEIPDNDDGEGCVLFLFEFSQSVCMDGPHTDVMVWLVHSDYEAEVVDQVMADG